MAKEARLTVIRIAAILLVIALSVYIFTLPEEHAAKLESYGYAGIFLLSILANATVLLPAPGLLIVFSMGARFHPTGVALAAGAGAAIGELSGYLAGFGGQVIIENNRLYQRMVAWMKRNGYLTVLVLAFLPNPFFDLTGIAAGALKMPLRDFLLWCFVGKTLKMLVIALAGAGFYTLPWLDSITSP
jgi:uncharacterized membrane protein YdjX (TVP38/TMEM64 family)